jgi:predicted ATPase
MSGGQLRLTVSLDDGVAHDITEVGFGISQVFPVLVGGLLQSPDSIFIVDLPEAHLHPRPQAMLADFFCSIAMSGKSAIVETHSEMFFHRLRLRASMCPELADKIAVYFIDEPSDGECGLPRRVGLTLKEEPRWPRGFLQEAWEMETLISLVRAARRT